MTQEKKEKTEIEEINEQLNKTHYTKFPWWILIIVGAFAIGFVFRYQIATWIRDTFRNTPEDVEPISPESTSGHTFVWDEPDTELLMYEDIGPGYLLDSIDDHAIILDEQYYHLPCPIYRFVQHGWTVNTAGNAKGEVIYDVDSIGNVVSLVKGHTEIKAVTVVSPTEGVVPIEDSFVSGFTIFSWDQVEFELPKGIKMHMKREDFDKVVEEAEVIPETNTEEKVVLSFPKPEWSGYSQYKLTVTFKNDEIDQIRIEILR